MRGASILGRTGWAALLGATVLPWLALAALFAASGGSLQAWLRAACAGHARADAFEFLDGIAPMFWGVHTCLASMAVAAARARRPDVLAALVVGPALGLLIAALGEDWSDPNWFVVVAVATIGWGVGVFVGGACWLARGSIGHQGRGTNDEQSV